MQYRTEKKTSVHRRIVSLPPFDNFMAKSKQFFSAPMDLSTTTEESETVAVNIARTNSFSSDTLEIINENGTDSQKSNENTTTVIITSPSINSNLGSEYNDSFETLDTQSVPYLQTKQRRIDHRRNKSEPFKSMSTEDLPSLTTNESSISNNNAKNETRRKSSTKAKQNLDEKSSPVSTTSKKKKAWYNPFQSTYRQRNEEFRKLFNKTIPSTERLIVDYSCAWQRDILAQGRMYISSNHLCFYANILNWKSTLDLNLKDIVSITREKTAKVISNAIEVKTKKGEKYFFASFVTRDKTFAVIEKIWNAAEQNQSIVGQQLWSIIHENYGDDLDMTTDDEDDHGKSSLNTSLSSPVTTKYDRIPNNIMNSSSIQPDDDRSSISSRGEHPTDDESVILPNEITYLSVCPCNNHLSTEIINRTYSMSVDHLFDCIFGENDFLNAYRASRRIKDYQGENWQVNSENGKRERQCTYKVEVAAVFGSTTICSTEKQIIDNESDKSYYIIDTEVRNEGIKYADSFYVASRYCLVQIGPNRSHLKVTCEVRYIKSLMAIIKTFIEKNAMAALQDSYTDLMKRLDQESSKQSRKQNQDQLKSTKEANQRIESDDLTCSNNELSINTQQDDDDDDEEDLAQDQTNENLVQTNEMPLLNNKFIMSFCILTMILLLVVNIFLCVKLNQIDHMTDRLVQNYPVWLHRYSSQQNDNDWSMLLKKQEEYYQKQLMSLQSVLITTHNALQNVTTTLNQLSQFNSRSS